MDPATNVANLFKTQLSIVAHLQTRLKLWTNGLIKGFYGLYSKILLVVLIFISVTNLRPNLI